MSASEYHVIDTHTKTVVGKFKQAGRARAFRDKKDNEYGAVRYTVKPIYPEDAAGHMKEQLDEAAQKIVKSLVEAVLPKDKAVVPSEKMMPRLDLIKKRLHKLRSGE